MKSDLEIAQQATPKPIEEIAALIGLAREDLIPYGRYIAKVPIHTLARLQGSPEGKLILVTAMTPTSKGEVGRRSG